MLCASQVIAKDGSQHPSNIFDLRTHKPITLFSAQQGSIFSFFEPECSWCIKQIKTLKKLQQNCDVDYQITLIGIKGNKQQLRNVLHSANSTLPAVQYPSRLRTLVGEIQATPTNVIFDNQHELVAKLRGFIDYKTLLTVFAPHCQTEEKNLNLAAR